MEHKLRSPGAVVSDDAVFAFYDARIPSHVVDGRTFEEWLSGLDEDAVRALELGREDIAPGVLSRARRTFPTCWGSATRRSDSPTGSLPARTTTD